MSKIKSDCIYIPAQKPPKNCQDYSICSSQYPLNDENPFLIICDGCGSSNNTDFGSRILARTSLKIYQELLKRENLTFSNGDYFQFGSLVISLSEIVSETMSLNKESLDSTLIFSFNNESSIITYMYGDGHIININKKNELISHRQISFEKNAPYYLSYQLNYDRNSLYKECCGEFPISSKIDSYLKNPITESYSIDTPIISNSNKNELKFHIISSDGIESFVEIKTGRKIPVSEVVNEIINIKSTNGEFIKRRVRRMIEEFAKKGIYNYDDISVAAFMVEE